MYKVGTGEKGTAAGKIYLFAHCGKDVGGHWVYCKEKLYLRRNGEELGLISVICPNTFKDLEVLKLSCGNVFKESKAANYNKYFPLLTDGENLFTVFVSFKTVKRKVKAGMQEQCNRLRAVKKEESKKAQDTAKICEFHLVEFDLSTHEKEVERPMEASEKGLVDELAEGFSGFFSHNECLKALRACSNNIEAASQWLLNKGESERVRTTVGGKRWVLLGQALTREGKDTEVVDSSVLSPNLLASGQWTVGKSQVAFYSNSPRAKIFSTQQQDVRVLSGKKSEQKGEPTMEDCLESVELKGSFVEEVTTEFPHYNQWIVTYCPLSHKFYLLSLDNSSIVCLLEYGDFPHYNTLTFPEQVKRVETITSPIEFAGRLFEFLKESEGWRYTLPWKWSSWGTIYRKACRQIEEQLSNYGADQAAAVKQSSKLAKVKKRAKQFMKLQHSEFLERMRLDDMREMGEHESGGEKKAEPKAGKRAQHSATSKQPEISIENTQVVKENIKEFAYCTNGSWTALKTLMNLLKTSHSQYILMHTYDQLLLWAQHCGVFCNSPVTGRPELVKELRSHLIRTIKDRTQPSYAQSYSWRILASHWSAFITTFELESLIFQEAVNFPGTLISGASYYELLHSARSTPFDLFLCMTTKCSAQFFPDQPVRQPHYQVYKLVERGRELAEEAEGARCDLTEQLKVEAWTSKGGALLVPGCRELEEYYLWDGNVGVKARAQLYSEECSLEGSGEEALETLRKEHEARSERNWKVVEGIVLSELGKEELLGWALYNKLVLDAMGIIPNKTEVAFTFANKLIAHASVLLSQLKASTANYSAIHKEHFPWISKLAQHVFWVSNFLYALDDSEAVALRFMPAVLSLVGSVGELVRGTECSHSRKCKELEESERQSYVQNKIFETAHPYGRRESNKKCVATFEGAIAVWCEIDGRSQTENSNDVLAIYSGDDNGFQFLNKTHRLSGNCNNVDPIIIPGNTLHIDFQVNYQPQKMEPSKRWGFKVTMTPIYGETSTRKAIANAIKRWNGKIPYDSKRTLDSAFKFLSLYALKLDRKLVKGTRLTPEETNCAEFFKLPLIKAGLKFTKKPSPLSDAGSNGSSKAKKEYKLHKKIVDPVILKMLEESEQGKGYLVDLVREIRQTVKVPEAYEFEKKRESFKEYMGQWAHAERLCALALVYHMGYTITEAGAKVDSDAIRVIGQSLNEIIAWMVKKLSGVKEYYQLKVSFLEECATCYEKCKDREARRIRESQKAEKPSKPRRQEKVSVAKSRARRKKLMPAAQKSAAAQVESVAEEEVVVKVSELAAEVRKELKREMREKAHDMFTQRCQGNTDLLKSLSGILKIGYDERDQFEALRRIFNELQNSLKTVVDFESDDVLPDNIPLTPPNTRSPYEAVAQKATKRAAFLFELHNTERKEKVLERIKSIGNVVGKSANEEADPFAELMLVKTPSMQPFLQDEQTPLQAKKAVDDYLKWKHSKTPGEEQFPTTMDRAVVAVVTGGYSAAKLRRALKVKEKRGLLRKLGLEYLVKLIKIMKECEAGDIVIGSIARSLPHGPFNKIEGCSMEVTRSIVEICVQLCTEITHTISVHMKNFKKITAGNITDHKKCARSACNQTKRMLDILVDFITVIQERDKNNIIASICELKMSVKDYFAKILFVMLVSNKNLVRLKYPARLSKLSEQLKNSILAILGKFILYIGKKPNVEMRTEIVLAILAFLEKQSGCEELMLNLLYDSLLSFGNENIKPEAIEKCVQVLMKVLESSTIPCLLKAASRCSQLVIASFSPEKLTHKIVQRIGALSMLANAPPADMKSPDERKYYLLLHLNSQEDDPTFLLTALYHLENAKPLFTNKYETEITNNQNKEWKPSKGPFDQTSLFAKGLDNFPLVGGSQRFAALNNLSQQFDEIAKITYANPKPEDSQAEQLRKLKEKNFNRRIAQHFSDAKFLYRVLMARSFVQYPIAVTREEGAEVAAIFERAYSRELEEVPINPHMSEEAKKKKLRSGVTVAESYPLKAKKQKAPTENSFSIPIVIAKGRLVTSLCEVSLFKSYFGSRVQVKKNVKGMKYIPIRTSDPAIGASYSLCIEIFTNLLTKLTIHDKISAVMKTLATKSFHSLVSQTWSKLPKGDKEVIMGVLVFAGGWLSCVRPGSTVEAVVNNAKEECTVVAGGYGSGSQTVSVVIVADESLAVHNIPLESVKVKRGKCLKGIIERKEIVKALLKVNERLKKGDSGEMNEVIRVLLLKAAAGLEWKDVLEDKRYVIEMLMDLAKSNNSNTMKRSIEEKAVDLWEKLTEKTTFANVLFHTLTPQRIPGTKPATAKELKGGLKSPFEYVQPVTSHLRPLPSKERDSHSETDDTLKLLDYWEKHIIPPIQDMVRGAYKDWENVFYFEQLRDWLRKGDISKAMEDALIICDQHLPQNCVLPKDNRDWSAFANEECIAGTWANAKVPSKAANPLVARIAGRRAAEVPVIVKAADWRMQAAFCEYADAETKMLMSFVVPIDSLKEQAMPLSVSAQSHSELNAMFKESIKELTGSLALRTLMSIYHSESLVRKNFNDLVNWIVMDELESDRLEGWLRNARPILEISNSTKQNEGSLITRVLKEINSPSIAQASESHLSKLEDQILKMSYDELKSLNDYCIEAWNKLANEGNVVSLDLTKASEMYSSDNSLCRAKDGNVIFPLHEDAPRKDNYGICIVTFEVTAFLSPNSKLKFYSDPQGLCLAAQMNVGKTPIQSIAPMVINHGKVWCHFHQGTNMNLSMYQQENTPLSSLPCSLTFLPALWTTACWLGETIGTALLRRTETRAAEELCRPLVKSVCAFAKGNVPNAVKQLAFVLVGRTVEKMRWVSARSGWSEALCADKLGISKEWLLDLIKETSKLRDGEDFGEESTYSEYIQNAAELIASTLLPFNANSATQAVDNLEVPVWVQSVIDTARFLGYFRRQGRLSEVLADEVRCAAGLKCQERNVAVVRNVSRENACEEVRARLVEVLGSLKVRIVDQEADIKIKEGEKYYTVSIITDGFELGYEQLLRLNPSKEAKEEAVQEAAEWECLDCSHMNPETRSECAECGSARVVLPEEDKPKQSVQAAAQSADDYEDEMWARVAEKVKCLAGNPGGLKKDGKAEGASAAEPLKVERGKSLLADPHMQEHFKDRLFIPSKDEFTLQVKETIAAIFEKMKKLVKVFDNASLIPMEHEVYVSAGLTKDKIKSYTSDDFMETINAIAQSNSWLVWELFAYYGYDFWLVKSGCQPHQELPKAFPIALLEDMVTMCEVEICKESKTIMQLEPRHLRFSPLNSDVSPVLNGLNESRLRVRYSQVLDHSLDEIRFNWAILKKFNDCLVRAVPYINWSMCASLIPEGALSLSISSLLASFRKLCFGHAKLKLQQAVQRKSEVARESPPKLVFERFKFDRKESEGVKNTMFYRAYEQMQKVDLSALRPQKPEGSAPFLSFAVVFKGEHVVGEGGPYRQFFADVSAELQPSVASPEIFSTALKLLCPTPNTVNAQGNARDKYTLTPSAKDTAQLLLYEFLGLLMGCCMRTGVRLALDLPSVVWKQITQEPLSLSDLEEVDSSVVGMLQYITQPNLSAEEFESIFTENFTAMLSDTSTVELVPNGVNTPVTFDRREEYAQLLLKARLSESASQCRAVRKGISLVVPEALVNFFTSQEIACIVCGRPTIDLQMLRRHTRYSPGLTEDCPRVQFLWQVLEELDERDKVRFIKFCWGQERLPANEEEYRRRQLRFMIKPAMREGAGNEENALPKADTCFFNLELPNYKTKEKLKEKLMIAIYTDFVSMNAEDDPALSPESLDSRLHNDY